MKILTERYDNAKAELQCLEACFSNVEMQAKKFGAMLDRVVDGNEADLLVIEIGRIMDKHARNMENM